MPFPTHVWDSTAVEQRGLPMTRRASALVATGVFLAGFATMNIFWWSTNPAPALRGLYSYSSATVGDGLILPGLAFVLLRLVRWERISVAMRRGAALVAVISFLGGVANQWLVLMSDATELNWTLPTPHTFNAAGWYHAVFLSVACAFFAWLATIATCSVRTNGPIPTASVQLAVSAVVLQYMFALLLFMDASDATSTQALLWPISAIAGSVIWLHFGFRVPIRDTTATLSFQVGTLGLATNMEFSSDVTNHIWLIPGIVVAFAGYLCTGGLSLQGKQRVLVRVLLASLPIVAVVQAGTTDFPQLLIVVIFSLLSALAVWLSVALWSPGVAANWTLAKPLGFFGIHTTVLLAVTEEVAQGTHQLPMLAYLAYFLGLILFIGPWVRMSIETVANAEQAGATPAAISTLKRAVYQPVFGVGVLAATSLVLIMTRWTSDHSPYSILGARTLATVTLIIGFTALFSFGLSYWSCTRTAVALLWLAGTTVSAACISSLAINDEWRSTPWVAASLMCSLLVAGVTGAFVSEGVHGNTNELHGRKAIRHAASLAAGCGLLAGSSLFATILTIPAWDASGRGAGLLVLGIALALFGIVVIPLTLIGLLPDIDTPGPLAHASPRASVLQDCTVALLMGTLCGLVPFWLVLRLNGLDESLSALVAYVAPLGWTYMMIMRANVRHVLNEEERVCAMYTYTSADDPTVLYLRALRRHCRRQNILGLLLLVPGLIQAISALASDLAGDRPRGPIDSIKKELWISSR